MAAHELRRPLGRPLGRPMGRQRGFAAVAGVVALLALVLAGPAAQAKPPVRPGSVSGVTMTLTKPADNFTVTAGWNVAANATTYSVALTNAANGSPLASNMVGTTAWSASVNLTGVTQVRLTVTPYAGNRPGTGTAITQAVPDLTAPIGSYGVSWVDRTGTITQNSLTDDSPVAQVTRAVSWGDGSATVAWTTGTTLTHLYAADGLYRPTVTLKDAVGNTRVLALAAIVPGDKTAPVGTFTTSPGQAWAALTPVNVVQTSLSDDFSPASYVTRSVDWGDGGAPQAWPDGLSLAHTYAAAGTYTPQVLLLDEANNTRAVPAPAVTVVVDAAAPVVKLAAPSKARMDQVRSWRTIKGTATDEKGTGVVAVEVLAVEKRATGWFFYKATSHTWLSAATKAKAWKRAKAATATPSGSGAWNVGLTGLRKGTLLIRVSATDVAGNRSLPTAKRAVIARS